MQPVASAPCGVVVGDWCQELATGDGVHGYAVRLTSTGDVILAGNASGPGMVDVVVARYTPDGRLVWDVVFGSDDDDFMQGMAIDANDNVFVVGDTISVNGSQSEGPFIAKVSSEGELLWSHIPIVRDGSKGNGVAANSDGSGLLVGSNGVAKYSPTGALVWSVATGYSGIAVDTAGDILVGGGAMSGTVTKLSPTGSLVWSKVLGAADALPIRIGFAPGGDLVILSIDDAANRALARYSASGAVVWTQTLDRNTLYTTEDMAIDANGNIFVVGMANDFGKPNYATYMAEYAPDGSRLWGEELSVRLGSSAGSLAVSSDGKIFISGPDLTTGSAFLVRVTP